MTNNTVRSAAIFEALAALHLPWIASTGRQGSEQTQRVLAQPARKGEGDAAIV